MKNKKLKELKDSMNKIKEKVESMKGEVKPLQMIKIGNQEFEFYGTQDEFFKLLKELQFGKFRKIEIKNIFNWNDKADVTINKKFYLNGGFKDEDNFDIEIGFKSKEIFSQEDIEEVDKLLKEFEKLSEQYNKLSKKKK